MVDMPVLGLAGCHWRKIGKLQVRFHPHAVWSSLARTDSHGFLAPCSIIYWIFTSIQMVHTHTCFRVPIDLIWTFWKKPIPLLVECLDRNFDRENNGFEEKSWGRIRQAEKRCWKMLIACYRRGTPAPQTLLQLLSPGFALSATASGMWKLSWATDVGKSPPSTSRSSVQIARAQLWSLMSSCSLYKGFLECWWVMCLIFLESTCGILWCHSFFFSILSHPFAHPRIWCLFEVYQTICLSRNGRSQGLLLCTSTGVLQEGNAGTDVAVAVARKSLGFAEYVLFSC